MKLLFLPLINEYTVQYSISLLIIYLQSIDLIYHKPRVRWWLLTT